MLFPKKAKHRKWQTGRKNPEKIGIATRGNRVSFGSFGLKAVTAARIKSNQIESARVAANRKIGKLGKMWVRIFPDRPFTAKAAEVGMGKGKGDPKGYCVEIKPGRILLEIDNVDETVAREALRKAGAKLPVKTKVVSRVEADNI